MMNKLAVFVVILSIVALIYSPGLAQDTDKDWEFNLAPLYLWGVAIDGKQTVKGQEADLDVSFSDIFNNLNGVFTVHFEGVRKQQFGFLFDLSWVSIEVDGTLPPGAKIKVENSMFYTELGGFYRIRKDAHDFDFLGGIRYTDMDLKLQLGSAPDLKDNNSWVDPIVGLRWFWHFADKWTLLLRGDVGGFGIGSDITWNGVGFIDYQPWKHVSLFGGYRVLYQDYQDGSGSELFKFDATMHGPLVGLNITW